MFVELVELLRCPRSHEESSLVVSASRTENRQILDGVLGCPVCHAEFPLRNGILHIGETRYATAAATSSDTAIRVAAFLELTDARGYALLCGGWAAHAERLLRLTETPLVLINPPTGVVVDVAAIIMTPDALPLAAASARAAAIDATVPASLRDSTVRTLRAGGRVLGPTDLPLPDHVTEIARDEHWWVGTKTAAPDAAPRLVTLKRATD